jgi:hypothetical protein
VKNAADGKKHGCGNRAFYGLLNALRVGKTVQRGESGLLAVLFLKSLQTQGTGGHCNSETQQENGDWNQNFYRHDVSPHLCC